LEDRPQTVMREYLSINELASYTGVSVRTLRAWIKAGMPHYRIGRLLRIKRSEFDEWMKRFRVEEDEGAKLDAMVDEVLRDVGMHVAKRRARKSKGKR